MSNDAVVRVLKDRLTWTDGIDFISSTTYARGKKTMKGIKLQWSKKKVNGPEGSKYFFPVETLISPL